MVGSDYAISSLKESGNDCEFKELSLQRVVYENRNFDSLV